MPFSYFLTDFALSASNLAVHLVQFMTEDQRKQIEVIQVGAASHPQGFWPNQVSSHNALHPEGRQAGEGEVHQREVLITHCRAGCQFRAQFRDVVFRAGSSGMWCQFTTF